MISARREALGWAFWIVVILGVFNLRERRRRRLGIPRPPSRIGPSLLRWIDDQQLRRAKPASSGRAHERPGRARGLRHQGALMRMVPMTRDARRIEVAPRRGHRAWRSARWNGRRAVHGPHERTTPIDHVRLDHADQHDFSVSLDVPEDHRFDSHDQLEEVASRNPVRFNEHFGPGTTALALATDAILTSVRVPRAKSRRP
jgi:hypothetical protein